MDPLDRAPLCDDPLDTLPLRSHRLTAARVDRWTRIAGRPTLASRRRRFPRLAPAWRRSTRLCQRATCVYHLADLGGDPGQVLAPGCAMLLASRPRDLETIGLFAGVSRQNIEQIEIKALKRKALTALLPLVDHEVRRTRPVVDSTTAVLDALADRSEASAQTIVEETGLGMDNVRKILRALRADKQVYARPLPGPRFSLLWSLPPRRAHPPVP